MVHTMQEKSTAVAKYRNGVLISEICSEFDVCKRTIYRWINDSSSKGSADFH